MDALQERVQDMTLEQVDDTAAAVSSEIANIRGISFITEAFDQEEIALILAVGVRRLQEWQVLQKKRSQGDVTSFARLQEIFGCNARTISECGEGKKYRYHRPAAREAGKHQRSHQVPEDAVRQATKNRRRAGPVYRCTSTRVNLYKSPHKLSVLFRTTKPSQRQK